MKLPVEWENEEKTIIRMIFAGNWNWHDFYEANVAVVALMQSVEHTVHTIADFRQSQGIPLDSPLVHARNAISALPDNWGILVIVTNNPLLEHLVNVFRITFRKMGARTFLAGSIEQAHQLIVQKGSSITP